MKKVIQIVILFCCLFGMVPNAVSLGELHFDAASKLNEFAFNLYRQVQSSQNQVISPYSLSSLLGRLIVGAGGVTRDQLMFLFQVESDQGVADLTAALGKMDADLRQEACSEWALFCKVKNYFFPAPTLNIANAFWADQQFTYQPAFKDIIRQDPTLHFYTINFSDPEAARKKINQWVEDHTRRYIKNLLLPGSVTAATRFVLTNAIYFKGVWKLPFDPQDTKQEPFLITPDRSVQVPMMKQKDTFLYAENDVLQMLTLRYKKSPLAMAILLPRENLPLQAIRDQLTPELFNQWVDGLKEHKVRVYLPKFKIESRFESLNAAMAAMGLTDAFNEKANFSQITDSPLIISNIIQKALVQVDEEGTIAAAATAVMALGAAPSEPLVFNANHPFLFLIFDTRSKLVLFIGQVVNPLD